LLPLVGTVGGDQVDRWDVAGDAVDGAVQAVVQRVDVAAGQSSRGGYGVFGGGRRLSVAGNVGEVIVSDETAAALRELVLLDPDCERLVFGMRAHPDGAAFLTNTDDLEELIGFVAAEANHEPNRRRQDRLDAAFNALTEAAQTLYS